MDIMRPLSIIIALGLTLLFAGCSTPSAVPTKSLINDPNGNFHLYVFNKSFAINPVDIKVFVDGELVVKGNFAEGSQHSYKPFLLKLSPGRHKIVAESSRGHARFEQAFEIHEKAWASLVYSYNPKPERGVGPSPRQFFFDVKEEPMRFL